MIVIKGRISSIDGASSYSDKRQRITIAVENAAPFFSSFKIAHDGEFQLDQQVKIYIRPATA
jgi:hypothetical protein